MLGNGQLPRVCNALLGANLIRRSIYFDRDGRPTRSACEALDRKIGLSSGEQMLVDAAFAVFNGRGTTTFAHMLGTLDNANLRKVGSLMLALGAEADGAVEAERWLADWRAESAINIPT